jgi:hypothetical protein
MPRRHLVDVHCFGADRRPRLTDDDGARGATANQAGSGERRRTNPEKFHTKLNSCRTAKLRLNVVSQKRAVTLRRVGGPFASLRAHQFFEVAFVLMCLDHVASGHRKRESPHHVTGCETLRAGIALLGTFQSNFNSATVGSPLDFAEMVDLFTTFNSIGPNCGIIS